MRQRSLVLTLVLMSCAPEKPPTESPVSAPAEPVAEETSEPMQENLPGFLGQTEIETPIPGHNGDQYWVDSDGVRPVYSVSSAIRRKTIPRIKSAFRLVP